jgi:hypothetical protein
MPIGPFILPSPKYTPTGKEAMYETLLRHGATRGMCSAFHLESYPNEGIIAWANDALSDEFSGELMLPGDK